MMFIRLVSLRAGLAGDTIVSPGQERGNPKQESKARSPRVCGRQSPRLLHSLGEIKGRRSNGEKEWK
jgi:hypothetical protein